MSGIKAVALTILAIFFLCYMSLSLSDRDDADPNNDLVAKKFEKIQEDFKSGNVQFIGGKPTFKIKANPILAYDLDEITGALDPKEADDVIELPLEQIQK